MNLALQLILPRSDNSRESREVSALLRDGALQLIDLLTHFRVRIRRRLFRLLAAQLHRQREAEQSR